MTLVFQIIIAWLLLQSSAAEAWENATPAGGEPGQLHILELDRVTFDGGRIVDYRDLYYPYTQPGGQPGLGGDPEIWQYNLNLGWDVSLLRFGDYGLVFDNNVHAASTDNQYRAVGWQYRLGLMLGPKVELYWDHHSQHILDAAPDESHTFPLYNSYGVQIVLYQRPGGRQ